MNARQKAFFEYHVELAQTFCTKEENTFWIFDLEDDLAFSLATRFQTPEELRSHLELQRSNGKMSAYTMTTNEDALHKIRKIENRTPLDRAPEGFNWIVLVSEKSFVVCLAPTLATSMAAA